MPSPATEIIAGFEIHRGFLDTPAQERLVESIREIVRAAPLVQPVTAFGKPMSVRMTSAGHYGWVIDRGTYRYAERHPVQGTPWPEIPASILTIWEKVADWPVAPASCLINWYGEGARMGLHQDRDERDLSAPVVSVSLGDRGLFRMGGTARKDPTCSTWLDSGDVVVLRGPSRLAHHGVDRIAFGSGTLLPDGGRLNLTLRVVSL